MPALRKKKHLREKTTTAVRNGVSIVILMDQFDSDNYVF